MCAIAAAVTFIIELGLAIGLILCIAHCSGYVTFDSTRVDKGISFSNEILKNQYDLLFFFLSPDVIAALLASINTAISIIFYNIILFLIGSYFTSLFVT